MNTTEYLLTKLIEELGEVQKACTKALTFGLHDTYRENNERGLPKWDLTPLQELFHEMNDVHGVLRLLEGHPSFPKGTEVFTYVPYREEIEAKMEKILNLMPYSREAGALTD